MQSSQLFLDFCAGALIIHLLGAPWVLGVLLRVRVDSDVVVFFVLGSVELLVIVEVLLPWASSFPGAWESSLPLLAFFFGVRRG